MIGICFYIEVQEHQAHRAYERWCSIADAFGADVLMGIPRGSRIHDSHVEIHNTLQDALVARPAANWVFVEQGMGTPLAQFTHPPEPVIYCFGRNGGGFRGDTDDVEVGDWIHIPMIGGSLFADQAAVIVMRNRNIRV